MQPVPTAPDLQLPQLELFVRVADAGSLSAAARQLQITPAAASAALKRLEASLAVRLIERSTRSMRLTAEGELLREHAQRALGVLDDMRALLGARRERLEGEVHVAAPSDLGRQVLSPMLDDFLAEHPGLRIALHVSDGMHDLLRERVDIAVRYGELPDSTMVARLLHRGPRVLVASPAYVARHGAPEHPRDLAKHNCLALYLGGRPQLQWTLVRDGAQATVKVHGNRRADDGALVRQWAMQGLGIAYKSRLDVAADLRSGALVELMPAWHSEPIPLHAVVPARAHMPLRVRRLLDALAEKFALVDAGGDAVGDRAQPAARPPARRSARPATVRAAPSSS
jgi:DNA-binding transcriptional LysR family regulator